MTYEYLYRCSGRRCPVRGVVERYSMGPAEFRQATGGAVRCPSCGGVLWYLERVETTESPEPWPGSGTTAPS